VPVRVTPPSSYVVGGFFFFVLYLLIINGFCPLPATSCSHVWASGHDILSLLCFFTLPVCSPQRDCNGPGGPPSFWTPFTRLQIHPGHGFFDQRVRLPLFFHIFYIGVRLFSPSQLALAGPTCPKVCSLLLERQFRHFFSVMRRGSAPPLSFFWFKLLYSGLFCFLVPRAGKCPKFRTVAFPLHWFVLKGSPGALSPPFLSVFAQTDGFYFRAIRPLR